MTEASPVVQGVNQRGGRSIRPFRLRKLSGALALVNVRVGTLNEEIVRLAGEQPWEVIPWQQQLGHFMTTLEGIEEACADARHVAAGLFDSAERDHEQAQRAALAILRDTEPQS